MMSYFTDHYRQALIVFAFVMTTRAVSLEVRDGGNRLGVLLEIRAIGMRLGFYAVQPFPGKLIFTQRERPDRG